MNESTCARASNKCYVAHTRASSHHIHYKELQQQHLVPTWHCEIVQTEVPSGRLMADAVNTSSSGLQHLLFNINTKAPNPCAAPTHSKQHRSRSGLTLPCPSEKTVHFISLVSCSARVADPASGIPQVVMCCLQLLQTNQTQRTSVQNTH